MSYSPSMNILTALLLTGALAVPAGQAATVVNLASGPSAANRTAGLGINLQQPSSWSPDFLSVNAAFKSRQWIPHNCDDSAWDNKATVTTDANGWVTAVPPGTCPGMLLLDEAYGSTAHYVPLGTYVLIWEGEGDIKVNLLPAPNVTCKTAGCQRLDFRTLRSTGAGPHQATFDITDSAITITDLRIMAFNPAAYIKNVDVVMPGGNVVTSNTLDYSSYCATARGPTGPAPAGTQPLAANQTCLDFATTYWKQARDTLTDMHRYNNVGRANRPVKVFFHPLTLQGLKRWRVLRAMDWMHTNASPVTRWAQRTPYRHRNQTESVHGVAFEYLATLANLTGTDLWVNVPHRANSDYVTKLATFLRDNVHPSLRVYVEYSNEIWNYDWRFPQGTWVEDQCRSKFPGEDAFTVRMKCQSELAVVIADKFNTVFGTQKARVVNVIASQAANSYSADVLLNWQNAASHFQALAIAPYFGSEAVTGLLPTASPDALFAALQNGIPTSADWVSQNRTLATAKGLRLIAYESGQHLYSGDQAYTPLLVGANRDPRMQAATTDYLNALKAAGLSEMGYFNDISVYDKDGSWGARESLMIKDTPKWNALNGFNTTTPCWWSNCAR